MELLVGTQSISFATLLCDAQEGIEGSLCCSCKVICCSWFIEQWLQYFHFSLNKVSILEFDQQFLNIQFVVTLDMNIALCSQIRFVYCLIIK